MNPHTRIGRYGWLGVLAGLTVFRLVVAACVPLTPDGAYYRRWALAPAAGYYDHPPMVALWIRLGMLVAGDTPLGLRALGPVSGAFGSILLAHAGALWLSLLHLSEPTRPF